jgi:hypothetical protein
MISPEAFAWLGGALDRDIVNPALTLFACRVQNCEQMTVTATADFTCGFITIMTCVISAFGAYGSAGPGSKDGQGTSGWCVAL